MISAEIDMRRPRLELHMPARKEGLPLVRQALRALARSTGADPESLPDAELGLTEACANAVRHAYGSDDRTYDVSLEARAGEILAVVRDRGRGIRGSWHEAARRGDGLGLTVIESVARDIEIRSKRGAGTEVVMALPAATGEPEGPPQAQVTAEEVVRGLVAMAGAQVDMSPGQITEALIGAGLIARHSHASVVGDALAVELRGVGPGIELRIGPLETGGAAKLLSEAQLPGLGSAIERFADRIWTEVTGGAVGGEQLAARFVAEPARV